MSWNYNKNNIFKQRNSIYMEPLKGEKNYELWSICIKALLASLKLVFYLIIQDYDTVPVIEGENTILESNNFIKTTSIIKLNCDEGPLLQIQYINKSYDIWMALQNLYSLKEFSSEFFLYCQLLETTLDNCNNKIK